MLSRDSEWSNADAYWKDEYVPPRKPDFVDTAAMPLNASRSAENPDMIRLFTGAMPVDRRRPPTPPVDLLFRLRKIILKRGL